jgi:hypothetical protein
MRPATGPKLLAPHMRCVHQPHQEAEARAARAEASAAAADARVARMRDHLERQLRKSQDQAVGGAPPWLTPDLHVPGSTRLCIRPLSISCWPAANHKSAAYLLASTRPFLSIRIAQTTWQQAELEVAKAQLRELAACKARAADALRGQFDVGRACSATGALGSLRAHKPGQPALYRCRWLHRAGCLSNQICAAQLGRLKLHNGFSRVHTYMANSQHMMPSHWWPVLLAGPVGGKQRAERAQAAPGQVAHVAHGELGPCRILQAHAQICTEIDD